MLDGIRELDKLGRIVLPSEIRKKLNLKEKEMLYVSYNGSEIIIKRPESFCVFCGGKEISENLNGKYICKSCINKLRENSEVG